jgi:GTPase SAR1 family protein
MLGDAPLAAKLVLLGDMGAGKSSLVLRFVKGQFHDYQVNARGRESARACVCVCGGWGFPGRGEADGGDGARALLGRETACPCPPSPALPPARALRDGLDVARGAGGGAGANTGSARWDPPKTTRSPVRWFFLAATRSGPLTRGPPRVGAVG